MTLESMTPVMSPIDGMSRKNQPLVRHEKIRSSTAILQHTAKLRTVDRTESGIEAGKLT
jgi:hypothetical protein